MASFLDNPAFTTVITTVIASRPELALAIELFKLILSKVNTMSADRKRAIMQMDNRIQFLFQQLAKNETSLAYRKELEIRLHETLYHAILLAEDKD